MKNLLPSQYDMPAASRRPQVCPSWITQEEFDICKLDPYQAFNAAQTKIAELHQRVAMSKKLNQALLEDPKYKFGQAVQNFERLKNEHIQLNDVYNDVEAVNETLQEVTEALRGDKHQMLAELNTLKREITIQQIENQQIELKGRQLLASNNSIDLKLQSQEAQLGQLDDDAKEAGQQGVVLESEITALEATCQNYSLQSSSLSDLRQHLDTTRVAQDCAIQALEMEIQSKAQEIIQHDAKLWDFKREMSSRILSLQKKAQEVNDEYNRLHRLSEHEINTLAAQNHALNDELKSTVDALFATRREKADFSSSAKNECHQRREEIQQCLSVLDLVERQNQGLEASIIRLMEQNKLSEKQIMEKDNINNKNLIEQANFISMVHMELQTTREDLYILKARLCRHCRETILKDEIEEDSGMGASRFRPQQPITDITSMQLDETGAVMALTTLTESERQRHEAELKRAKEALEALNRQLLEERASRDRERKEDWESRRKAEEDRKLREVEEEEKWNRAQDDERKIAAGEEAQTFVVRLVDGTCKKIDAFPTDTVGEIVHKICTKLGIQKKESIHYHLSHTVNENSIIGAIDRFLDKDKTLSQESITPKSNLVFKVKHYKRHKEWTDKAAHEWFFRQIHQNIISEYYPVTEKLAVELASLEIQSIFGDASGKKRHSYFDRVGLDSYLPVSVSAHEYDYWQDRLYRCHKRHKGFSSTDARTEYIEAFARQSPYWGLTFFDVSDRGNNKFIAGIGEDGMYIFSATRRDMLASLRFDEIAAWNSNPKGISVKKRASSAITIFGTSELQSKEMLDLLNEYYMMLSPSKRGRLGIVIDKQEELLARLPPHETFLDPIINRRIPVDFMSRLEQFKVDYMEHYLNQKPTGLRDKPVTKLCRIIDDALDEGRILEDIDLSDCEPPLSDMQFFTIIDTLKNVFAYVGDPDQFSENMNPKSLSLAHTKSGRGGALTDHCLANVIKFLKRFPKLQALDLSNIPIDSRNINELTDALCGLHELKKLILKDCKLENSEFEQLVKMLLTKTNGKLEILDVQSNNLTRPAIEQLCSLMINDKNGCKLKELNVGFNKIDDEGLRILVASISILNNIRGANPFKVLKCGGNSYAAYTDKLMTNIMNLGLVELSLTTAEITIESFTQLSNELAKNKKLQILDLSNNNTIGYGLSQSKHVEEVLSFLAGNQDSVLTSLDISNCGIRDVAGAALASILDKNTKLTELKIGGNIIANGGQLPKEWYDMLKKQRNITKLDLSNNSIKYQGLSEILKSIGKNGDTNIRELRLDGNDFDTTGAEHVGAEVKSFLERNHSVRKLYMIAMGISDDILIKIGEGLAHNSTLQHLDASTNRITANGIGSFSDLLSGNSTLQYLDISGLDVPLTEEAYLQIYKLLIDSNNYIETVLL